MISVDFIVELPESHGYDAIMNVVDSVTKCMHFIPMHTTITAKGTPSVPQRGLETPWNAVSNPIEQRLTVHCWIHA
jgi:hypothetical protein